ncbi:unnamed protein product [Gongylonema pulchrum]|uniref:DUF4817 domain-containing protein n=1 Tax=Gongylonema pulchrum TaxID=637853 RepID=A0A183EE83_9BILA|nr:unnamed protein product [Gongylonema pulchrum]
MDKANFLICIHASGAVEKPQCGGRIRLNGCMELCKWKSSEIAKTLKKFRATYKIIQKKHGEKTRIYQSNKVPQFYRTTYYPSCERRKLFMTPPVFTKKVDETVDVVAYHTRSRETAAAAPIMPVRFRISLYICPYILAAHPEPEQESNFGNLSDNFLKTRGFSYSRKPPEFENGELLRLENVKRKSGNHYHVRHNDEQSKNFRDQVAYGSEDA